MKIMTTPSSIAEHLQAFVADHAQGWSHYEWLELLGTLEAQGIEVKDPEAIGADLERTRLATVLSDRKIKGLGPRRVDAIVEHFGTLWNVNHASAEDFAAIRTIPQALAEELENTLAV